MWERVAGQERAVALLQHAAERPVHSYLLAGPRGSGVEEAARYFAAALIAPDQDERASDLALRGRHPDVVEVDPPESILRVETAKVIVEEAHRSPIEGDRKVIVLFDAERLNESAANKLLKTIEEPPATTHIVLLTADLEAAGYPERTANALKRRLVERHKREHRRARTDALVEGITAFETMYRDALAGPDAPAINTDRPLVAAQPRSCDQALLACRAARDALGEFNPSESLLLERLLLHLPGSAVKLPL